MKDRDKTRERLISELTATRQRIAKLDAAEAERVRAKEALPECEEKWRSLTDSSPDHIMLLDTDYVIRFINHTVPDLTTEQVIGKSLFDFEPSDDHQVAVECFERVVQGGKPDRYETRYISAEGETQHFAVRVSPLTDRGGNVTGLITNSNNVTERVRAQEALQRARDELEMRVEERTVELANANEALRAEIAERVQAESQRDATLEELRESEHQLRLMTDNIPAYVSYVDADQRYRFVNQKYTEAFGIPPEEIIGKHFKETLGEAYEGLVRERVEAALSGQRISFEAPITLPRGGKRWLDVSYVPDADDQGRVRGYFALGHDITERKQAESQRDATLEALRESEERFRLAFENANVGMCLVDLEGRLTRVNRQMSQISGYSQAQLESLTVNDIAHPEDVDVIPTLMRRAVTGEVEYAQFGRRYFHKDGHVLWLQVSSSLIRHSQGAPLYFVAHIQDITERKQAEEQVKAALAEKEVLLREVHHRVKNNLTALISLIHMQAGRVEDPEVLQMLASLQGRVRAMGMVHETLYRAEDLAQIDFEAFLKDLTHHLVFAVRSDRPIALCVEAGDIRIDMKKAVPCGLMVNELLTNALKHAFPEDREGDREIRVGFEERDQEYVLVVSDNGVGLPPELDWRTTDSLGLKLVNLWATYQLEGSLKVDTHDGTTFTIRFPK